MSYLQIDDRTVITIKVIANVKETESGNYEEEIIDSIILYKVLKHDLVPCNIKKI